MICGVARRSCPPVSCHFEGYRLLRWISIPPGRDTIHRYQGGIDTTASAVSLGFIGVHLNFESCNGRVIKSRNGYIRVILNCVAFSVCYSQKSLSAILYVTRFVCDALDGWFARRLNQVQQRHI